jgi:predicted transcriptional regulator of viral defense system
MKYEDLLKTIQAPYFSRGDHLLDGQKLFDYQISLWVKKGNLLRLKNGMYAFAKDKEKIKGEEIASFLYEPSYLSLESALSWHGFIPEMVYAYVSLTARINRKFTNAFGTFLYRHIKPELFWGYTEIKTEHGHYLLAEPEKALLDYLYLNLSKIRNEAGFDNVRFNMDMIKEKLNADKFLKYLSAFDVKKMKVWALRCLQ